MVALYSTLGLASIDWQPKQAVAWGSITPRQRQWVQDPGSTTVKFQRVAPHLSVDVCSEGWETPSQALLPFLPDPELAPSRCYHREVHINNGPKQPLMHAITLIPEASAMGAYEKVRQLGGRALGTMLFQDPQVKRGAFQFALLSSNHPWAQRTISHGKADFWVRYSCFTRKSAVLLLFECFLPELWSIWD